MFASTDGGRSDEETPQQHESIADFYAGKSVFITGVTGFLGKAYLEKLLYSCKDIDKVFVLIRNKRGDDVGKRIEKLLDSSVFSRLRSHRPEDLKKITPVYGDIDKSELGLSLADQERLIKEVSVVFHVAASVNLDADLKTSLVTNYFGTTHVLKLCHRMKKLKVFVYVSTAYCNTTVKVLEEKVYPLPVELDEVVKIMEQPHLDSNRVKKLLNGRPNTYALSKALAEHYIAENHGDIPVIFIRPSIVTSSAREPAPGWADSFQGATALITACWKRVNRVIYGNGDNIIDLIPVDYVSNLSIVAAAKVKSTTEIAVYNSCTSSIKPMTLKGIAEQIERVNTENKQGSIFLPTIFFTSSWLFVIMLTFVLQLLPSFIADLFLYITGNKPMYMKIQSKVLHGRHILNYYTNDSWVFKSDSSQRLQDSLSPADKRLFPCCPSDIKWDEYFNTYFCGIDNYLLKRK
ncbi:unnamed protein product [Chrysodeixis includens]|uniref:Fatty acyl-CoA reductase n=1 Tax=Chrysodeixis includens TaxID=689277 RepID=A0A9P0BQA8_CHRIL|nr:unnamed protein product [Chrysodeixis includens]